MKNLMTVKKALVKNLVDLYIIKGYEASDLKASTIEYEVSEIVDDMNMDNRQRLENYIVEYLKKLA